VLKGMQDSEKLQTQEGALQLSTTHLLTFSETAVFGNHQKFSLPTPLHPLPRPPPAAFSFCAVVLRGMQDSEKWQTKEGALQLLTALADSAPAQVAVCLPTLVPLIAERMVDAREQVCQQYWSSTVEHSVSTGVCSC
jgi:hypothetical protein